jgi:hypothetical protein
MYQRPSSLVFDRRNSLWRNLLCCVPFFGKGSPDLAYDLSRFKSHATLRNNPSYIVGDKLGIEVPDFVPGSSQNARIPRGIFTWDGIVTLHFWFYLDAFPGGDTGLFDNQWGNDNSGGFQVLIQGSGGNMVSYAGDLTGRQGIGSGGISTGKWFCYILEADAINDTLTVWLNNEQAGQNTSFTKNTVDGGTSNAGSYRFFANSQENNYLDGKGFNVMLWDRRLTPSERAFLYVRPFGMYLPTKSSLGFVPITITPISVSDSGSGSEALSLLNLISLADSGLGWDALAPLLLFEQFNSVSGWDQDQGTWQATNSELDPVSQNANNWGGMVITKNVSYKDFDAYMRIKTPTDNKGIQFIFRTGSTEGSGYGLQLRLNDGNFRIENWGVANLNNVSYSYTNGVYYRVRVRVRDSNIKAKIWLDGSSEPSTWNIDFNDTTFPNAGKIGFSSEDSIAWFVDWLIIESYDVSILASVPVSDIGSGSDVISVLAQIALSDSGSATHAISVLASIVITDLGSMSSEAISALIQIALSDTGASSEAVSILASLAIQDSAVGSEIISIVSSFLLADSSTGIDTISIANSLTITDSGSGSELLSILAQIVLSDSGSSSEALSILAQVAVTDSALGSEALQILANFIVSDSGTSSEALNILVNIAIPDSAIGNEALTLLINIALSETAIANETILLLIISGLFTRGGQLSNTRTNLYNRLTNGLYNKR